MINILVTGSNGQLGLELKEISNTYSTKYNFFFTDLSDLDITNHAAVNEYVVINKINIIINCAAYTAVDKAEDQAKIAYLINHVAVENMAKISKEYKLKFIHISTDYVFDGKNHKPYKETDLPNPQSIYGKSKLAGEESIIKVNPNNSIIIRTSWLYSKFGNNFVSNMKKLAISNKSLSIVSDQIGTPTNAADLAKSILLIINKIDNSMVEIFHYSNEGVCSWYDFAKLIFEIDKNHLSITPVLSSEFKTKAKRPHFSVLSKNKIKDKYGLIIPHWADSFRETKFQINKNN